MARAGPTSGGHHVCTIHGEKRRRADGSGFALAQSSIT